MGWQGKERGVLFKVLAGFSFLIRCQTQQRYLPNVLAMGLVLGLYSIAPRCLCPAALLLLESVGFLWCRGCCRACAKILLLLTAGYVSGAWKSRRALSTPLAGQAVSESCNFFLATWGWGRTCMLRRETACFTVLPHLPQWPVDWDCLLKVRGDAGLVPVVPTVYLWPTLYRSPISLACGAAFSLVINLLKAVASVPGSSEAPVPAQSYCRIRPAGLCVHFLQKMHERWRHKSDSRLEAETVSVRCQFF